MVCTREFCVHEKGQRVKERDMAIRRVVKAGVPVAAVAESLGLAKRTVFRIVETK